MDRPPVELVDLPCFGRPARLVWRKHRWCCPDRTCPSGSWTAEDPAVAPPRSAMTDRAGRLATVQVGRGGRAVAEVARELGCDWHTVNDAVMAYGAALLEADIDRVGQVDALGQDETLFARLGRWRTQAWCTSIVDVTPGSVRLLEVIPGRSAARASVWIDARPEAWRPTVRYGVLDLSGPYRKTLADSLDHVTEVADAFHLIKLANQRLDECRRRVQNETLGHRDRNHDPLYRAQRLLTEAHERLGDRGNRGAPAEYAALRHRWSGPVRLAKASVDEQALTLLRHVEIAPWPRPLSSVTKADPHTNLRRIARDVPKFWIRPAD